MPMPTEVRQWLTTPGKGAAVRATVPLGGIDGRRLRAGVESMRFQRTKLPGAWLIEPTPSADERGFFARTFCMREFAAAGLETRFVQHSMSYSARRGTLRGMHFQVEPHSEVKVVTCQRGAIYDVIVDMRPGEPTRGSWEGFYLTDENMRQLYIPKGFAHGFITLTDDVEVAYLISEYYTPDAASGLRYDDPSLAIIWPMAPTIMSERDRSWPPADVFS